MASDGADDSDWQVGGFKAGGNRVGKLVGETGAVSPRSLVPEHDFDRERGTDIVDGRIFRALVANVVAVRLVLLGFVQVEPRHADSRSQRLIEIPFRLRDIVVAEGLSNQVETQLQVLIVRLQSAGAAQIVICFLHADFVGASLDGSVGVFEFLRLVRRAVDVIGLQRLHLVFDQGALGVGKIGQNFVGFDVMLVLLEG